MNRTSPANANHSIADPAAGDPAANDLDRLLQSHLANPVEPLTPSSGFVQSVMESIHAQATEPPPIAFPWRRALPGAIAVLAALIAFAVVVLTPPRPSPVAAAVPPPQLTLALTSGEAVLCWILLAACLSIAAIAVSFRLTRRT